MRKLLPAVPLALLLLPSSPAEAGGFEAKTMRAPLSSREVERPLIIGKGWLEFGLGADVKQAKGYWGPDGEPLEFDSATWLYTTESLTLRYGIARRAELYWHMPVHYLKLENDLGANQQGVYIGDPRFGWNFEVYRTDAPLTSVITRVEMKVPAGNEVPGSYIAGPATFTNFITTTGTADLLVGLEGKRQFGIFGVQAGTHYTYRFSGLASYLIETENNQFNARIKPGWIVDADVDGMLQLGPVALIAGGWFLNRDETRIGTTSPGLFPDQNLQPVAESGGWAAGVHGGATLNATRNVDLVLDAELPLRGEDFMFFPIEDLHPTRGVTWSADLEFRF